MIDLSNEDGLVEWLRHVDAFMNDRRNRADWKYQTYEGLVLAHGRPFEIPERGLRPDHIRKLPDRLCFTNALRLAVKYGYTYVEGYASSMIPVLHAWNIDHDGLLIDPTWAEYEDWADRQYYGIPMHTKAVQDTVKRHDGYFSVLGSDYMDACTLLQHGPPDGLVKELPDDRP